MSADRKQRVVVADDDVLLREGVAGLLERAGYEIAGQAGDAAEPLRSFVRSTAQALVTPWSDALTRSREPRAASA